MKQIIKHANFSVQFTCKIFPYNSKKKRKLILKILIIYISIFIYEEKLMKLIKQIKYSKYKFKPLLIKILAKQVNWNI